MNIQELAEEKVRLENRFQAIQMTNVYGMTPEEKVNLEIMRIDTMRELSIVTSKIDDYIKGK